MMYQDTGMYRNRQYTKAEAAALQTMYERNGTALESGIKIPSGFRRFRIK